MSRRSTLVKLATKAAIVFGALFLVTVLLAAIPAHQQRALEVVVAPGPQSSQDSAAQAQTASQHTDSVRGERSRRKIRATRRAGDSRQ